MVRSFHGRTKWRWLAAMMLVALPVLMPLTPSAQQGYVHLNPVIDKLSKNQMVFGVQTNDLSMSNARALARAPIDFVYIDFEHNPLDIPQLEVFLAGMTDKAMVLKKGNLQPNVAVIARFPPYAHENAFWVIKQALDIGLMGIMVNNTETKEQALKYVQMIRYNRPTTDPLFNPQGLRGSGGGIAAWFWGVSGDEYDKRADLWPLNPQGDLLLWPMIETVMGVKNAGEIVQVPGVSGLYTSSGGDLHMSMAVPNGDPRVKEAYLSVIKTCASLKKYCGGTVGSDDIEDYVKAGAKFLRTGAAGGGLSAGAAELIRDGRALLKKMNMQ